MIWFSSDSHFGHLNLCLGTSKWTDKSSCRNFPDPETMSNHIISNINSVVGLHDTLYHLGDFALGGVANYFLYWRMINCKNIHLITGNHDNIHGQTYDPEYNGVKVSTLFSSYSSYKEIFYNKTRICLFHFPIASWNEMAKGAIHLFGHCHSCPQEKFRNGGKSMDVGLDGNNFFPYSIDEIFSIMADKPTKREGHHA